MLNIIFAYFSTFLCHILMLDNISCLTTGENMSEISRIVRVDDVCKTLPNESKPLLRHVNFTCGSGEIAVITGANGAGKSTLLKIMAGLVKPDSGTVRFNNNEITSMSGDEAAAMRCSKLGYMPQKSNLVPLLTVEENVILPFVLSGLGKSLGVNIGFLVGENAEALKNKPVSSLSGGEAKMVMLSRIFSQIPDFVLLDEPTDGVDDDNIKYVFYLIYYFVTKQCPVIIVSHDSRIVGAATKAYTLNEHNNTPSLLMPAELNSHHEQTWLKTGILKLKKQDGTIEEINMKNINDNPPCYKICR